MDESLTTRWFDRLLLAKPMVRVFSDQGRLQGMLDFEAALARALADAGIIPAAAAAAIGRHCQAHLFHLIDLAQATAVAGNSAIPVITKLEELVAADNADAARYVHFGATSQDAMDTGLVLQIRAALALIDDDLQHLSADLAALAAHYKSAPAVGRTWLQHAAPTTIGLRFAGWLSAIERHRERIVQLRPRCLVVQLGGAVGTLAAYDERADQIASLLARDLGLGMPDLPWHAQRDRLAEVAAALGLIVGTLGKMARDISLLSQAEIAEVAEPAGSGRGGSTSMPQKRNPVGSAVALAAAARVPALVSVMLAAMPQELERGLGGWQAEWETLPEIFTLTAGALAQMRTVIAGLSIDPQRARANLDAAEGLIYAEAIAVALTPLTGRAAAHALTLRACRRAVAERRSLAAVIEDDAEIAGQLTAAERKQLCDPERSVRAAARLVDRLVSQMTGASSPRGDA